MQDLKGIVLGRIEELGVIESAKLFGVSTGTVSNWRTGKTSPSIDALVMSVDEGFSLNTTPSLPKPDEALTMWSGRRVAILLPVYRSFNPDTHYTLFANYVRYGPDKIAVLQPKKRTLIVEARNYLVDKALKTEAEYFISCDDDMILPCGNAGVINGQYGASLPEPSASFNAISRIMSHPASARVVGCLYFGRHQYGRAQCALGFNQGGEEESDRLRRHRKYTELIAMDWVGTGFIRIHRSVFAEFKKAVDGGLWPECKPLREDKPYGFFTPIQSGMGEDVSFGLRCKQLGIASYLDPALECLHAGDMMWGSHNTRNRT